MTLTSHLLAAGHGWSVSKIVCTAGPNDRPFEERHDCVCIAAVLSGHFRYRTVQGGAALVPGAVMLGNAGEGFECTHEHGTGDQCLSFHFDPAWFEDIAAAVPGARRASFSVPRIPPLDAMLPLIAAAAAGENGLEMEEAALGMAAAALTVQQNISVPAVKPRDERHVGGALRVIAAEPEQSWTVAALAQAAGMSAYHFLRVFRDVTGITPHQYILNQRLNRAASRLRMSGEPIGNIALDAGFNDLSSFNRRFRRITGMSPGMWRRLAKG